MVKYDTAQSDTERKNQVDANKNLINQTIHGFLDFIIGEHYTTITTSEHTTCQVCHQQEANKSYLDGDCKQ